MINKQRVYLNSCQLLIESVAFTRERTEMGFYFLWRKGKKSCRGDVFEVEGVDGVGLGQRLELSLKLYYSGNKPEPKNTTLYLHSCRQSSSDPLPDEPSQTQPPELTKFTLPTHEWSNSWHRIQLQLREQGTIIGTALIQVRRIEVMELENFQRYAAEIEDTSGDETQTVVIDGEQFMGVEFVRVRNQLEDFRYLNQKLKKDRTYLLCRNQVVEKELNHIKANIKAELTRMQQHYQKKIYIHASIYQQQIQNLITTFNQQSNTNTLIMRSIITQNQLLAAQITELRLISQQELQKQQAHHKQRLDEANHQIDRLQDHLEEAEGRVEELEGELVESGRRLELVKEELDQVRIGYGVERKEFEGRCEEYEMKLESLKKQIMDTKNTLAQKTEQLTHTKQSNTDLQQQLKTIKQKFKTLIDDKIKTEQQLQLKKQSLQLLTVQKQQKLIVIKRLEQDYQFYIRESEKKSISYQKELEEIDNHTKQKEVEFERIIAEERQQYYAEHLELTELRFRTKQMQNLLVIRQQQIKTLNTQTDNLKSILSDQQQKLLQNEQQLLLQHQQSEHYRLESQNAYLKLNELTDQLDDQKRRYSQDLELLKSNYEEAVRNRERLYEEEVEGLRRKVEDGEGSYVRVNQELRLEVEELRGKVEELQGEVIRGIGDNNQLVSTNKQLQFEITQYQQLLTQTQQSLKQRQQHYEQTIKMLFNQKQPSGPGGGRLRMQEMSSLEDEVEGGNTGGNVGGNGRLAVELGMRIGGRTNMSPEEQEMFMREVQSIGSLEHIRYLKSVDNSYNQIARKNQNIQKQNKKLRQQCQHLIASNQQNENQIAALMDTNTKLQQLISQLQQQLKHFLQKQTEYQNIILNQVPTKPYPNNDNNHDKDNDKQLIQKLLEKSLQKSQVQSIHEGQIVLDIKSEDNVKEVSIRNENEGSSRELRARKLLEKLDKSVQDSRELKMSGSNRMFGGPRSPRNVEKLNRQVQVQIISMKQIRQYQQLLSKKQPQTRPQPPHPPSPTSLRQKTLLQKQTKQLQKKLTQLQQDKNSLEQQVRSKQAKIDRLEARNKEIFDEMGALRQEFGLRLSMQESKLLEYSVNTRRDDGEFERMRNTMLQKDQQLRLTNQNLLTQKTLLTQQNHTLSTQIQTLKRKLQQLTQSQSPPQPPTQPQHPPTPTPSHHLTTLLQQQLQQSNRKLIDSNRTINQLKVEKQGVEDQVRMLRRKVGELERVGVELGDRRRAVEEELEGMVKKYNKCRRELEEKEEQLRRLKDQLKKLQQQSTLATILSTNHTLQRKKLLQQKLHLEQQLTHQQSQLRKQSKQLQKAEQKLSQLDRIAKNAKMASGKEIERLEGELLRMRKENGVLEDKVGGLEGRVGRSQDGYRGRVEELREYYKEKLGVLVGQINDIKALLTQNSQQLKQSQLQNQHLHHQLQTTQSHLTNLKTAHQTLLQTNQTLKQQIAKNIEQLQENKHQLEYYQEDSIEMHGKLAAMQEELSRECVLGGRRGERIQELEGLLERCLYEGKVLKVELAGYKDRETEENNYKQHIVSLQAQLKQQSQKLIALTQQHQHYKSKYIFTKPQFEQLLTDLKTEFEQTHKRTLADTVDQLDHQYETKNIQREKELIELYNENVRVKLLVQRKEEECGSLLQRYGEIEMFPGRYREVKGLYDGVLEEVKYLRQQQEINKQKLHKLELQVKQYERVKSELKNQVDNLTALLNNQKKKSYRLQRELLEVQTAYSMAKDDMSKISSSNYQQKESQKTLLQSYEQKLLSIELQNSRIKQREQNMHRQYKQQLKKLQQKIKQLISSTNQKLATAQRESKLKHAQKDTQLKQSTRQLNSLSQTLKTHQQQLTRLKAQNEALATELANTRTQLSEDQQIYILQINKLKTTMREMEDTYAENLAALEEELEECGHQLMIERINNRQVGGELVGSRLRESQVERKLEEKLRVKDLKIQQLKNNVFTLEQSLIKLKRSRNQPDTPQPTPSPTRYQTLYTDLTLQLQTLTKKHEQQTHTHEQALKQLKKQLLKQKQIEQDWKLRYDQLVLEMQSVRCQLTTTRDVYENLQRELEKRQIKLAENVGLQVQYEKVIEESQREIGEYKLRVSELESQNSQLQNKVKSRQQQLDVVTKKLLIQTQLISKIKNSSVDTKKISQFRETEIQSLRQQIQKLMRENRKLSNQLDGLKSDIIGFRGKQAEQQRQIKRLVKQNREYAENAIKNEQIINKYSVISDRAIQLYGITAQQIILGGYFDQKLFDQQHHLSLLKQQLQQLKFNEDRTTLDNEQLKKQNLQLQLKVQDHQFVSSQVETLRRICDKLQEEKKIAVFREEALKVRLANLISKGGRGGEDIRDGLEAVLNVGQVRYV